MKERIITFLKDKLGITELEQELESKESELNHALAEIRSHAMLDVDVAAHPRGNNTIILTGIIKNRGYVRFYDLDASDFEHLAAHVRELQRTHTLRNVDRPYGGPDCMYHAAFKR